MKAINLGKKSNSKGPMLTDSKGPTVYYPSFSIDDVELPLTSKDVGKTITATVQLKVNKAGAEIDEYGDKKKRFRASFSVTSLAITGRNKIKIGPETDKGTLDDMEKNEFSAMSLFGSKPKRRMR